MNRLDILIAVVAIGFIACWLSLRSIEYYLQQSLLKLLDIDTAADGIQTYAGQISASVDKD